MARKSRPSDPQTGKESAEISVKQLAKLSRGQRAKQIKKSTVSVARISTSQRGRSKKRESVEEMLQSLAAGVPEEAWRKLPADLTENLDHYLYGIPKK
jgi:hypothetical protein